MGVEALDWQGEETQPAGGWIGGQKCEFILKRALNSRKT